jgi:hypothetical protein
MEFHSPARPTITNAGHPAYPWQAPLAALPGIVIHPTRNGFRLSLWLVVDTDRTCVEHIKFIPSAAAVDIIYYLTDYLTDPEATMRKVFGWPGVRSAAPEQHVAHVASGRRSSKVSALARAEQCAEDIPEDLGI